MFAKQFRLPSFVKLSSAKTITTPLFLFKVTANELSYNRYGFVVGKAVDKRAVVRNRTKRRLRAVVESLHTQLSTGHDMLFMIKKSSVEATTEEIQKTVYEALRSFLA